MPTALEGAVKSCLDKLLKQVSGGTEDEFLSVDIWREASRQALLAFETQKVRDTIDADPLQAFQKQIEEDEDEDLATSFESLKSLRDNLKSSVQVMSISRSATLEGFSSVDATIQFTNMQDKPQLYCSFQRQPLQQNSTVQISEENGLHNGRTSKKRRLDENANAVEDDMESIGGSDQFQTHVTYNMAYSSNFWGPKLQLLFVEVWARDRHPSLNGSLEMSALDDKADRESSDENNESNHKDQFNAHVDPEILANIMADWQVDNDMDVSTILFILMTFPFYEHEWDLVSFLLDAVLGDEEDDEGDDEADSKSQ